MPGTVCMHCHWQTLENNPSLSKDFLVDSGVPLPSLPAEVPSSTDFGFGFILSFLYLHPMTDQPLLGLSVRARASLFIIHPSSLLAISPATRLAFSPRDCPPSPDQRLGRTMQPSHDRENEECEKRSCLPRRNTKPISPLKMDPETFLQGATAMSDTTSSF